MTNNRNTEIRIEGTPVRFSERTIVNRNQTLFPAFKKAFALLVTADGAISAIWGHRFMHWLRNILPEPLKRIPVYFLDWPEPTFRLGALLQALAGVLLWRL